MAESAAMSDGKAAQATDPMPYEKGPSDVTRLSALTPRQVARELGLPLVFPRRKRRATNAAPSWDQVQGWAVDAYWERQGTTHGRAA